MRFQTHGFSPDLVINKFGHFVIGDGFCALRTRYVFFKKKLLFQVINRIEKIADFGHKMRVTLIFRSGPHTTTQFFYKCSNSSPPPTHVIVAKLTERFKPLWRSLKHKKTSVTDTRSQIELYSRTKFNIMSKICFHLSVIEL